MFCYSFLACERTGFDWVFFCCSMLSFLCNVLYIVVCPFDLFLLAILLSDLRITRLLITGLVIFKLFSYTVTTTNCANLDYRFGYLQALLIYSHNKLCGNLDYRFGYHQTLLIYSPRNKLCEA